MLIGLMLVSFFVGLPIHVQAQTVPLSVLKAGTNQTSYAASYFANSANVTANGDGSYTVTSAVTTEKSLGNYPVQIISIDGAPANVSKSDNGSSQSITYSYRTNNVAARHAAVIKVDVDSINYHHTYDVGLQLDANAIKTAPQAAQQSQVTVTQQDEKPATMEKQAAQADETDVQANTGAAIATQSSDETSAEKQVTSTTVKKTFKKAETVSNQPAKQSAKPTEQKTNQQAKGDFLKKALAVVGGGLGIGILAAVTTIWYSARKK